MNKTLLFLITILCYPILCSSQEKASVLPQDKSVRIGTLDNGMKYYIYPNKIGGGLVDFYIIHDVGAMQEIPSQYGMAHFLEHMAFNGTTHFEKDSMVRYFESKGLKMGVDMNAKTGFEDTQYMICNVPTYNQAVIDTALLAISDWSGEISLKEEAVDKERPIIIEEIRRSKNTSHDNMMSEANFLWRGSDYEGRSVIGEIETISSFRVQELKDFYHTWYRPDMQAVVVVGDVDVDEIEAKIRKVMGEIPASESKKEKKSSEISSYSSNYAMALVDESSVNSKLSVNMLVKSVDKEINNTSAAYALSFVDNVIALIMTKRFYNISNYMNSPFLVATFGRHHFTLYNDIVSCDLIVKKDLMETAISLAAKELKKMHKFGVTENELSEALDLLTMRFDIEHRQIKNRSNSDIAQILISNFLRNTPILEPDYQLELDKNMMGNITPEFLNACISSLYPQSNCYIVTTTPNEKRAIVSEKNILKYYDKSLSEFLEMPAKPMQINFNRPLVAKDIKPVSIAVDTTDTMGNIRWELANGARVIVRPMAQANGLVRMYASRKGGLLSLRENEVGSASVLNEMINIPIFDNITPYVYSSAVRKKIVDVKLKLSLDCHEYIGECLSKDTETLFHILNLNINHKNMDNRYAFGVVSKGLEEVVRKSELNSEYRFERAMSGGDIYVNAISTPSLSTVNNARFSDVKNIYNSYFNGVKGVTFVFAGDVDTEELRGYVETYIATLPEGDYSEVQNKYKYPANRKSLETINSNEMHSKARYGLIIEDTTSCDYNIREMIVLRLAEFVIDMQNNKVLREELGATYGCYTQVGYNQGRGVRWIRVNLETNIEALDNVSLNAKRVVKDLADGVDFSHKFASGKEALINEYKSRLNNTNIEGWMSWIDYYYRCDVDYLNDFMPTINTVTAKEVQQAIKDILNSGRSYELIQKSNKLK